MISQAPPRRACSTLRFVTLSRGPAVADTPPQGKAKYNAWKKVVEEGISAEQAQEKYVAKIEEMKTKYGYDANKEPEAVGGQ
jgi:hypothetical protein